MFVCLLFGIKKSFGFYIISCSITERVYFAERSKNKNNNPSSRVEQNYTRNLSSYTVVFCILEELFGIHVFCSLFIQHGLPPPLFFPNSARHVNLPFFLNLFIFTICVKRLFFSTNKTKFY